MNAVEPIRSEKKIKDLKKYLLGAGNMRNYALIVFGLNSALRISDLLELKWKDVYDFTLNCFKEYVYLRERKTNKIKQFILNDSAKECLTRYQKTLESISPEGYIFVSREGENKHITRYMAIKIVKSSCEAVGIREEIGCHSLRKTFGYMSWKKGVAIPILMEMYNHSNQSTTKRYLGITQNDIDEVYRLVQL